MVQLAVSAGHPLLAATAASRMWFIWPNSARCFTVKMNNAWKCLSLSICCLSELFGVWYRRSAIICVQQRIEAGWEALNLRLQVKDCVSKPPLRLYITEAWKQDVDWTLVLHWSNKLPVSKPAPLLQYSIKLHLLVWLNQAFQRFGKKFLKKTFSMSESIGLPAIMWKTCSGNVLALFLKAQHSPILPNPSTLRSTHWVWA